MLQLLFSFSLVMFYVKNYFSFSFSKFLMLQFYFSLVLVTFNVNHYINIYNVLFIVLNCYCQFIQSVMKLLILLSFNESAM